MIGSFVRYVVCTFFLIRRILSTIVGSPSLVEPGLSSVVYLLHYFKRDGEQLRPTYWQVTGCYVHGGLGLD